MALIRGWFVDKSEEELQQHKEEDFMTWFREFYVRFNNTLLFSNKCQCHLC